MPNEIIDLAFFGKLVAFTAKCPNSVTRLWSTPSRNLLVGGAPSSGHLILPEQGCCAVDLVFDSTRELLDGAKVAVEMGFNGIEVDLTNKHLHLDGKPRVWRVVRDGVKDQPLKDWLASRPV
jgi:hypothetical protein